jgi:GDPmannose 4,6-dehydratase
MKDGTHSVRDFIELALKAANLDGKVEDYVLQDPKFFRPSEVDLLVGDASKAKAKLDWEPTLSFSDLVYKMVESDLALESKNII